MKGKSFTPEDLKNQDEFEFLTEVSHTKLKEFILDQIANEKQIIRYYSIYQLAMILILIATIVKAFIFSSRGIPDPIRNIGWAALFSFTALVIIHELLHAAAYLLTGAKKLSFGAILKKFIFYVVADQQVIAPKAFRIVALAPFITVKLSTIVLTALYWQTSMAYLWLSIMCLHSLFCAGDIAMLAFYKLHPDKEIYNYDDMENGMTYFYYHAKR